MSEDEIAEYEANRNHAMDIYFNARPQLLRTRHEENIFEAGFKKAWEQLQPSNKELLGALKGLVNTKEYKDDYGKDKNYIQMRVIAWSDATKAIANCLKASQD